MTCPIANPEGSELLLALAAGKADAQRAAALEDHLAGCPACAGVVARQRAVAAALDLWEAPPVSLDFDRRLYGRIEREVPWWDFLVRPFRPALGARFLPAAAAAALLLAAGLWLERPARMPAPVPTSAAVDALPADQAEHALEDMKLMQEFSRLMRAEAGEPRM